jgi:hypothetical protein
MSESLQQLLAIAIVAVAMLYIGRRMFRAVVGRAGSSCSTGCGKCSANETTVIGIQPLGKKTD